METGRREKWLLAPLPDCAIFESKRLNKHLTKLLKIAEITSVDSLPYAGYMYISIEAKRYSHY